MRINEFLVFLISFILILFVKNKKYLDFLKKRIILEIEFHLIFIFLTILLVSDGAFVEWDFFAKLYMDFYSLCIVR